jgi:UDP-3-O-[3-hydroxymyristoyl] glucosamine N-acyltransferase
VSTRLDELVNRLGGELRGDGRLSVTGVAPLAHATNSEISFLSNSKLRIQAGQSHAAALILTAADDVAIGDAYSGARLITNNPYAYFARTAQWFALSNAQPRIAGVHPSASIDPSAQIAASATIGAHVTVEAGAIIGADAQIGAGSFIGRSATIGTNTYLHPHVTFESNCHIGENGIVHSGTVIGADGFGFANDQGVWIKIPQTGGVRIGNDVEIGANTCIDRGALTDTVIDDGVKLDNQIQIGHNCHIGAHTAIAGCVGVAGSATIGKYCMIGGAAMIAGHLTIADHVVVSPGTMITHTVNEPGQYSGYFPFSKNADWQKSAAIIRNLASMREKIRDLEKSIKSLTEQINEQPGHQSD